MGYAATSDLIARYGEAELIRLTTPSDADMAGVDAAKAQLALDQASAEIDTYLRRRYTVPATPVVNGVPSATLPIELVGATCTLARYALAFGDGRMPTDQMKDAREETLRWLRAVSLGTVLLDIAVPSGPSSYASSSDRQRVFGSPNGGIAPSTGEIAVSGGVGNWVSGPAGGWG